MEEKKYWSNERKNLNLKKEKERERKSCDVVSAFPGYSGCVGADVMQHEEKRTLARRKEVRLCERANLIIFVHTS